MERKRVWTVFLGFGLAVGFNLVAGVAVIAIAAAGQSKGGSFDAAFQRIVGSLGSHPGLITVSLATSTGSLILLSLFCAWRSRDPTRERLRLAWRGVGPIEVVAGTLGALAIGQMFECLVALFGRPAGASSLDILGDAATSASPAMFAAMMLFGSLGAGLGEELFFRGYMQTRLSERFGIYVAIGVSALAFGAMHLDPLQSPFACAIGLYLGWLAQATGAIALPIIIHTLNNATSFALSRLLQEGESSRSTAITMGAISVVVLIGSIWTLHRRLRPRRGGTDPENGSSP